MSQVRREKQLAYSEIQSEMSSPASRIQKAHKIHAVLDHFLGDNWVHSAVMLDVGASVGWNVEVAAQRGAHSIGVDIDVPGLARARQDRDPRCLFVCGDGQALPFADDSIDVVVFNHVYEHMVDADAVVSEIYRVLSPTGVAYMGLPNKLVLIEPHHRLPFLSWLPAALADRYLRAFHKGDHYYESHRSVPALKKMLRKFHLMDYSFSIIAHPDQFSADDMVNSRVAGMVPRLPSFVRAAAEHLLPSVIWIATKSEMAAKGAPLAVPPTVVRTSF